MYVKAWAESAAGAWRRPLNGATLEPRRVTPTVHAVVCATVPCDCGEQGDQDRSRGGATSSQSSQEKCSAPRVVHRHALAEAGTWAASSPGESQTVAGALLSGGSGPL